MEGREFEEKRQKAPPASRKANFPKPFGQRERDQYRIAQELVKTQTKGSVFVINPVKVYESLPFAWDGLHFSNDGGDPMYKLASIVCNALDCGRSLHQLLVAQDQFRKKETRAFPPRPDRMARMIFPKFTAEQFAYWNWYSAYSQFPTAGGVREVEEQVY